MQGALDGAAPTSETPLCAQRAWESNARDLPDESVVPSHPSGMVTEPRRARLDRGNAEARGREKESAER